MSVLYDKIPFQSTLPMRGATGLHGFMPDNYPYFNPHSPCGERPEAGRKGGIASGFQSTLPMRGATTGFTQTGYNRQRFQSTLPMRGATDTATKQSELLIFQSTLPMRGATAAAAERLPEPEDFNPHSPCGERRENRTN